MSRLRPPGPGRGTGRPHVPGDRPVSRWLPGQVAARASQKNGKVKKASPAETRLNLPHE